MPYAQNVKYHKPTRPLHNSHTLQRVHKCGNDKIQTRRIRWTTPLAPHRHLHPRQGVVVRLGTNADEKMGISVRMESTLCGRTNRIEKKETKEKGLPRAQEIIFEKQHFLDHTAV